jgi:hypothetical protein
MTKKKDAYINRDFSDAGTESNFTGGTIVPIEEGAFANYAAAGLVREPTAEDLKAAAPTSTATSTADKGGSDKPKP